MMRIGFPGYGSALQARVRSPARNAGATRSLAAQRRFKRTDGASGGDVQSSIRPTLVLRYDDGRRRPSRRASWLDQCGGLLHDRLGRGVSLCQKRVDLGRCERLDLQLRLVRIGAKFTIGYRGVEGAPQRGETIGWHAGRRGKRAPRLLPDQDQLQHLPALYIGDEVERARHVRQVGKLGKTHLDDDVEELVADPVRARRLDGRPGQAADTLGLAALDRERQTRAGVV